MAICTGVGINPVLWFLQRFTRDVAGGETIKLGARVKTKHGWATVIGGSIITRLDQPVQDDKTKKRHKNDNQWSFNIGKEWI